MVTILFQLSEGKSTGLIKMARSYGSWARILRSVQLLPRTTVSLIAGADDTGNLFAWRTKDASMGQIETDLVKQIAIAPSGSFIVITTEKGLDYLTPPIFDPPRLERIWRDNTSGGLESFIEISSDSSTVITSGDTRVSSHTSSGILNWRKDVFQSAITDMACSSDCSTIVLGSQDGNVVVLNQLGQEQWKYPAGSWINGVGVSRDGTVIAAGTLDKNLYILNKEGRLIAKTTTDTTIQPRSVAVSGDGKHIVVADQVALYGFELTVVPEVTPGEIFTSAPISYCYKLYTSPPDHNPAKNTSPRDNENGSRENRDVFIVT